MGKVRGSTGWVTHRGSHCQQYRQLSYEYSSLRTGRRAANKKLQFYTITIFTIFEMVGSPWTICQTKPSFNTIFWGSGSLEVPECAPPPPTRILIYTKTCTRTSPTQEAGWEPLFLLRNNFHKSDYHLSFVPPIGGIFKTSKHLI